MATPNTYERKPGLPAGSVPIVNASPAVNAAAGRAGENPLDKVESEIDVEQVIRADAVDMERFMQERLSIMIDEPGDPEEPMHVEVSVNGILFTHIRGSDVVEAPRFIVGALANAKTMRVRQVKVTNPDGSMGFQEKPVIRQAYPFTVVHDPSGSKGNAWLRQLLANPA